MPLCNNHYCFTASPPLIFILSSCNNASGMFMQALAKQYRSISGWRVNQTIWNRVKETRIASSLERVGIHKICGMMHLATTKLNQFAKCDFNKEEFKNRRKHFFQTEISIMWTSRTKKILISNLVLT